MTIRSRGFTLIELVVTLAVFSVLLAYAVTGGRDLVYNNRISAISMDLMTSLNLARMEATRRNTDVMFTPRIRSTGDRLGNGWILWVDENDNGAVDGGEEIAAHDPVDPAVKIASAGVPGTLIFRADGTLGNGSSAIYQICDNRERESGREISVLVSGRIRVDPVTCD